MLVQHGASPDESQYPTQHSKTTKSKTSYYKKISNSSNNTLISKSSTGSSDTEPFYLHPPSINPDGRFDSPPEMYGSVVPNDGLYINPMRNGIHTPTSPSGSVSGESFYLHDPQEVIYNRVKDLFESDSASNKEGSTNSGNGIHPNAMTVQVEVHSSSSGAGSGSEESLSVSSSSEMNVPKPSVRTQISNVSPIAGTVLNNTSTTTITSKSLPNMLNNNCQLAEHHDYEDIYLVREEARNHTKANKYSMGRRRSRDSGSHSRSGSANSTHSTDIVVHYGSHVSQICSSYIQRYIIRVFSNRLSIIMTTFYIIATKWTM